MFGRNGEFCVLLMCIYECAGAPPTYISSVGNTFASSSQQQASTSTGYYGSDTAATQPEYVWDNDVKILVPPRE